MKKSDFWKKIWTPIRRNIPPEIDKPVLIWNPAWKSKGEPMIIESYIAHHTAKKILDGDTSMLSDDRFFTHWCLISGPEK